MTVEDQLEAKEILIQRVEEEISRLGKEMITELRKNSIECNGHIVTEIEQLRADQIRSLYKSRIKELRNELKIIKGINPISN